MIIWTSDPQIIYKESTWRRIFPTISFIEEYVKEYSFGLENRGPGFQEAPFAIDRI